VRRSKAKAKAADGAHTFAVVSGVEGPSLYANDYRIAGPKPWGGGKVIHRFEVSDDDLRGANLGSLTAEERAVVEAALSLTAGDYAGSFWDKYSELTGLAAALRAKRGG
jgi:hypothetical protein